MVLIEGRRLREMCIFRAFDINDLLTRHITPHTILRSWTHTPQYYLRPFNNRIFLAFDTPPLNKQSAQNNLIIIPLEYILAPNTFREGKVHIHILHKFIKSLPRMSPSKKYTRPASRREHWFFKLKSLDRREITTINEGSIHLYV